MEVGMVIGYIKKERKTKRKFRGIEIKSLDNNYIITIFDEEKNKIKRKLAKYIQKLNIEALVFSVELDGKFKSDVCDIIENNIRIINGRKLMEYMEFDIFKYILNKQKANIKQEDIYIVFKKDSDIDLNFLKEFIENFRLTNVVTNDIEKLKNVQENLLENDNILISVSNNKKKALKRAKYILNVNLTKEELEKYKINREAIIVNIKENVKYNSASFDGINISNFKIEVPDEFVEKFEEIGGKFDLVKLYESILFKNDIKKSKLENIYERIHNDNIKITELLGNNGIISENELQKIYKQKVTENSQIKS